MGTRLYIEVLDYAPATLTHREKLLLAVLGLDADEKTRTTWGSVESPEILRRAKVSRSQLYAVIKQLLDKGALERTLAGQKNAAAKYKIPRLAPEGALLSVPDSGTLTCPQCQQNRDTENPQCPGFRDTDREPQCPENADTEPPQCPGSADTEPVLSVPDSGTPSLLKQASQQDGPPESLGRYPEAVRPLMHAMSASGVDVSWPFKGDAWAPVITLIETVGIDAMVSYAVRASARTAVFSARYFVAGWTELPPKPPEGTPDHRPRLRAVGGQHYISPEERGIF